jgi:hypothetical protein
MSRPTKYSILRQAIQNRQSVQCDYHGHVRLGSPHCIGHSDGQLRVLMYQFGGASESGLAKGGEWRCMNIEEIHYLAVINTSWHTNPKHTQEQTCIRSVDLEILPGG